MEAATCNRCGHTSALKTTGKGLRLSHPAPAARPGDSSSQEFPWFVLLSSTVYPSLRSVGASVVSCFPITATVEGQPLGLFSY